MGSQALVTFSRMQRRVWFGRTYDGRVSVRVVGGTGRVSAYGQVIDSRTEDPTYIPAQ